MKLAERKMKMFYPKKIATKIFHEKGTKVKYPAIWLFRSQAVKVIGVITRIKYQFLPVLRASQFFLVVSMVKFTI